MPYKEKPILKKYYTIGETCRIVREQPELSWVDIHTIRFWSNEHPLELSSSRTNQRGDRKYTPEQIDKLVMYGKIMATGFYTSKGAIHKLRKLLNKTKNKNEMVIRIKKIREQAVKPSYSTENAACFDIFCASDKEIRIAPGETKLVGTGLVFEIPEGHEVVVRPISSMVLKTGLVVPNSPATIDSDYRGEVYVMLHNTSKDVKIITDGDRIAQGKMQRADRTQFMFTDSIPSTERGGSEVDN